MQEQDKINILVRVAKAYYVEGCTQNEIAKRLHVSRPLVSKYLNDAKEAGIVRISIHEPVGMDQSLGDRLISRFQLKAAHVVAYSSDQELVAQWLSEETLALFEKKMSRKINDDRPWLGKYHWSYGTALRCTTTQTASRWGTCPFVGQCTHQQSKLSYQ